MIRSVIASWSILVVALPLGQAALGRDAPLTPVAAFREAATKLKDGDLHRARELFQQETRARTAENACLTHLADRRTRLPLPDRSETVWLLAENYHRQKRHADASKRLADLLAELKQEVRALFRASRLDEKVPDHARMTEAE